MEPLMRAIQLEGWLREQEQGCCGQLHFQVLWLPANASWLDQIEIWLSLLQRKLLQPNHFVSTQDLEQATSRVYHLLQPDSQTDQLDLYRREA
jgi:hypothetical protein